MKISEAKYQRLENLSTAGHIIAALAIDQRDSMEKMMPTLKGEERTETIKSYKSEVSRRLTQYASSILLDPIYGLEASKLRHEGRGLLLSYEISGYEDSDRSLRLLDHWSVKRLIDEGADAAKILLYYDVDDNEENNDKKKAVVERIGAECRALDLPFFLEIITYDRNIEDSKSLEFAKRKPHKVLEAMKEFSKEEYMVDVLKMEVPVNMNYVEGYGKISCYSKDRAKEYFLEQSKITNLPYIFLSAGVSMSLFMETLRLAKEAGAEFHGVLCGRATWKGGVDEYIKSRQAGIDWLESQGKENIQALNEVIEETSTSWTGRLEK